MLVDLSGTDHNGSNVQVMVNPDHITSMQEMVAELEAVKPARERLRELQEAPELAWARGSR